MARSMAIPARIDEVTGKVQLMTANDAVDVNFDQIQSESQMQQKGRLVAGYHSVASLDNPKYYSHFTLSKLNSQGRLQLLSYDEGDADMGGGTTWAGLLKDGTELDAGD